MDSTASISRLASERQRFGFDESAARSRGTAFALITLVTYLGVTLSWGASHGWRIGISPGELAVLIALTAIAQRTQIVIRPRFAYTPATLVVVFTGLIAGPFVGLLMGGATALATEAQWRPRLVWGSTRGFEGMAAGLVALALQPTGSTALPSAFLALVAANAISLGFVTLTTKVRRSPSREAILRTALSQSAIEAIIALPLVAALAIGFSSNPWLSLAALASLVAAIGFVGRFRRRYLTSLEMERLLARHDPTTGAPNRRAFLEALSGEHSRLERDPKKAAGLLFIDFDHFKRVNDRYSHAVGDEALSSVVERLAGSLRAHDIAARWGGEEFVLLAPDCDRDQLFVLAERTRRLFADEPLPLSAGDIPVTVSIGAALLTAETTPEEALEQANKALKLAKRTRNTTRLDSRLEESTPATSPN